MTTAATASLLSGTRLFGTVAAADLDDLAGHFVRRVHRGGEPIFRQGDGGDALFVVVGGLVKVYVTSPDGEDMLLVTLGPRETFGELALVDGGPRSASAQALETTELLVLRRADLLAALAEHPTITEGLLRSLGALVRRLTDQAADLVFLDLHGRVAKLLLRLAEDRCGAGGHDAVLDLQLTQADLASMLGGSRQSVNQILRSFAVLGHIELD